MNLVDPRGTDAIYVCDYDCQFNNGDLSGSGLALVGHAAVIFTSDGGTTWHFTQFTGSSKSEARVCTYTFTIDNSDEISKDNYRQIIERIGLENCRTIYIEGDFSESLEVVNNYLETDYGGYNLIENNCLDYVKEVLSSGEIYNDEIKDYIETSDLVIVPNAFASDLSHIAENEESFGMSNEEITSEFVEDVIDYGKKQIKEEIAPKIIDSISKPIINLVKKAFGFLGDLFSKRMIL